MGCFFGCFRFKDDDRQRSPFASDSTPSKSTGPLVSRNQLASVFLCEETGSPCEDDAGKGSIDQELKHEVPASRDGMMAKFLKACGALLETPAEIRKVSEKINVQTPEEDDVSSKFHSLPPDTYCKKLHWDEKPDENSSSTLVHEDFFAENKYGSSLSEKQQTIRKYNNTIHSVTFEPSSVATQCNTKSVRFEVVENYSGIQSCLDSAAVDISLPQNGSQIQPLGSKHSPYPTPLKLTEEMLTPGTVYPANLENLGTGKSARIRSQYVYPVLNPVVNLSQWKAMREESRQLGQSSELFEQRVQCASSADKEQMQQGSLSSLPVDSGLYQSQKPLSPNYRNMNIETVSMDKPQFSRRSNSKSTMGSFEESHSGNGDHMQLSPKSQALIVSSLSQWLQHPPLPDEERRLNSELATKKRSPSGKSPDGDRPIIGIVAAHWNDVEPTRTSPKWWDGNGIPNSTTKYKEDQKVSWHATPFEERLEKALSDETLFPQRNLLNGQPIELNEEDEERDTAASRGGHPTTFESHLGL